MGPTVNPCVATTKFSRLTGLATIRHKGKILSPGSMASAHRSSPFVTVRNNWRPYHKTGENPRIVTIRHTCATTIESAKITETVTILYNRLLTIESPKIAETVTILYSPETPLLARMRIIIIPRGMQQ
jgi:hypothetical protein